MPRPLIFIDYGKVKDMASKGVNQSQIAKVFGISKRNFVARKKTDDLLRHNYESGAKSFNKKSTRKRLVRNLSREFSGVKEIVGKSELNLQAAKRLRNLAMRNPAIGITDLLLRYGTRKFYEITSVLGIDEDTVCDALAVLILDLHWIKPNRDEFDDVIYSINEQAKEIITEKWQKLGAGRHQTKTEGHAATPNHSFSSTDNKNQGELIAA